MSIEPAAKLLPSLFATSTLPTAVCVTVTELPSLSSTAFMEQKAEKRDTASSYDGRRIFATLAFRSRS